MALNEIIFVVSFLLATCRLETTPERPNIVFILADDLGWNDVGYHGSNQIPTPNIDALAYAGLILNNYYVSAICTPSRSALMTGKHPIHTGMQHTVLYGAEARGLPLSEKMLPQYLEELGYVNHIVGKWHLGCYTKDYTPLYRGFKSHLVLPAFRGHKYLPSLLISLWGEASRQACPLCWPQAKEHCNPNFLHPHREPQPFLQLENIVLSNSAGAGGFIIITGYWTGHHDYYDHTAVENPGWGLDMRRNLDVAYDLHGQYSTDVFTAESVRLINEHNKSQPLFIYLAHAAVHSANPYTPLPASDEVVEQFSYISDYKRRRFAAMLSRLDHSVGEVTKALQENNMLENTIIIFSTDNGGPAAGFNLNAASNYPLRGVKNTLWEGGVRGAALIWSALINKSQRVADQMMHVSDWLPTLIEAAGGDVSNISDIDGISTWTALSNDEKSNRTVVLHNIDDIYGNAALTVGPWKLIKGTTYNGTWDSWYGPSGRDYNYSLSLIENSAAGQALRAINKSASRSKMEALRGKATIDCTPPVNSTGNCYPLESSCLFNILTDPCETNNLANEYPNILHSMEGVLEQYNKTAVPPGNLPLDPRGDPKNWDYVWTNFGDYTETTTMIDI